MSMNLDTLVAEAMGYNPSTIQCDYEHNCVREYGVLLNSVLLFHPSTNIAHAHIFAEQFDEYWINKIGGGTYEVEMNSWAWAHHQDKCIAICIAGLRATGVSEERIKEALDGKA